MNEREWDRQFLWRQRAKFLRNVDGDTVEILADSAWEGRHLVHIRLEGFSAAERYAPGGAEATARMDAVMATGAGEWPLRVISTQKETIVKQQKTFSRYVGHILICQGDGELRDVVDLVKEMRS